MKLENIELIHKGEYLSYYELEYKLSNGSTKTYEIVSHKGSRHSADDELSVDSLGSAGKAVIVQIYNKDHSKMLLSKEYRLGVNKFIYNNVAGFMEAGETYEQAAIRETFEETGLKITRIIDVLNPSYTCAPVCDDLTPVVVCEAEGDIVDSTDEIELTHPVWATKEEVKELLSSSDALFSGRLQAIAYMWVNS